jgi:pimeloyl-ACP methyl ester carboxylesterase
MGGAYGLWMAGRCPERVTRLVAMATVPPEWAFAQDPTFWERRESYDGWEKKNAHYWRAHYVEWVTFFMEQVFMELTLTRRPFLYCPLIDHFEQMYHVAHRLKTHGAGRRIDYARCSAENLAELALQTLGSDTTHCRPPEVGAARRAASKIAELL